MKRKIASLLIVVSMMTVLFSACGKTETPKTDTMAEEPVSMVVDSDDDKTQEDVPEVAETREFETKSDKNTEQVQTENSEAKIEEETEKFLQMKINDIVVNVLWEENESVSALMDLCKDSPLEVQMTMYGGFEQVGHLGTSLPREDAQTTTSPGDIVLYSGNQIVVFYGSNSWNYTRLGHITDRDNAGMTELLGNGDVKITISLEEKQ